MENWFELPNDELFSYLKDIWYTLPNKLIGKYVKNKNYRGEVVNYFIDIRSSTFGKLEYPKNNFNKEIEIFFYPTEAQSLEENNYYEIIVGIKNVEKRIYQNRLSIFHIIPNKIKHITPQDFIQKRQKLYTTISIELADTIRKAIKTLSSDINREPETFIYELLQNADDYYDIKKNSVEVRFTLTDNYLLFTHNGQPFNYQNVYALTGISQGDKRDNKDAIGFKGIGFKSIFKDSSFTIIKSGGFEFKFDEACFPNTAKRPWQIIPIWVPTFEEELSTNQYFRNSAVSIAIKPNLGNEKLRLFEKSYKNILSKVFIDDRILIFLKKIDKVIITDLLENEYLIELNKNKEKWFISINLKEIDVDPAISTWLNNQIENEDITIPEKYLNISKTKITFAVERIGTKLTGTTNSKIYTYLPTEIDFGFKFLINGDFIPDGSRTELHNNEWNNYLGNFAGNKFVEWLSVIGNNKWQNNKQFDRDYIDLIPDFNNPKALNAGRNSFFLSSIKKGFDSAITGDNAISFIPTQSGKLESLSNILVDETGLVEILQDEFVALTGIEGDLIHREVGIGIEKIKKLISEYGVGTIYSPKKLKENLSETMFINWIKQKENNLKLIAHLHNSNNTQLKGLLESENIIQSESGELYQLSKLYCNVPEEVNFLVKNRVNLNLKKGLEIKNLNLPFKQFNAIEFYKEHLRTINTSLTNAINLINCWNFIYDNWNTFKDDIDIKNSLKSLLILCKTNQEGVLNINQVSSAYIPKEFSKEEDVETIIDSLNLSGKYFINNSLITNSRADLSKWNDIFKSSAAKRGLKDVITELINQLGTIDINLHFKACTEIFRYWKTNKAKSETQLAETQISAIKANLKLKCTDNNFRNVSDCIISDYFNNNTNIESLLPEIVLYSQISSEYGNQIQDLKTFFKLLGCIELSDKQSIFERKVNNFIECQDQLQNKHIEILMSISTLYKTKNENALSFDFKNLLSKIKLLANDNQWYLPINIHLSIPYNPKLNLQNDVEKKHSLHFLNDKYLPAEIDKYLLTEMGVNESFKFLNFELKRDEIPTIYRQEFEKKSNYIVQNAIQYGKQHRLINHIDLNYKTLLKEIIYAEIFWNEVIKINSKQVKFFFEDSIYKMAYSSVNFENFVVNYIKQNATLPSQMNVLRKPNELFSSTLSDYIENKNDLTKFDFSKITLNNNQTKSLEDILEIQKSLSPKHCIELLSRNINRLTIDQITNLDLINILKSYSPNKEEKSKLLLLNKEHEWKPITSLFISTDEKFQINPLNQLHELFYSMADNFGILKLAEKNLILKTTPESLNSTEEIGQYLKNKAKYIAFKIDHLNHLKIEAELMRKWSQYIFHEAKLISKVFPEINPIYQIEIDFNIDEINKYIIYKGNWKTNEKVKEFLFLQIQNDKIERLWFENLINRWDDDKIIQQLDEQVGETPKNWKLNQLNVIADVPIRDFFKEVTDYIEGMREVEDIYDSDKIEELKSLLASFKNQPEEKKKSFNLLAKLKLCKQIGLNYKNDWDFNKIDDDINKYFIHSARGSFAYIHPHEIIQMKDNGFKMAIDYGGRDIRIYNDYIEILDLYQNYLMLYQGQPSQEEILKICEQNQFKGKFHFLIVDREKQTDDAMAILKILNADDYE